MRKTVFKLLVFLFPFFILDLDQELRTMRKKASLLECFVFIYCS